MAASLPIEYRVVILQAACAGIVSLGSGLLAGPTAMIATLAGGGCIVVPNAFMARRTQRHIVAGAELVDAVGVFVAMFVKFGLTILLLALALRQFGGGSAGAFFAGVGSALLAHHASFLMEDASNEGLPPPRPEPEDDDDW